MRVPIVHLEIDACNRERLAQRLRAEAIDCAVVGCRGAFPRALKEPGVLRVVTNQAPPSRALESGEQG